MKPKAILHAFLTISGSAMFLTTPAALAQSGNWTPTAAGPFNWSGTGNWSGGIVADGTDSTASFTPNITTNQTVTVDTVRTIGNITFTDSVTSNGNLTISGANILTLDRSTGVPIIDVTQSGRTLTISSVIAGTDGLQKDGAGQLTLSNAANTFSGDIVLNGGTLSVASNTHLGNLNNDITVNSSSLLITTTNGTVIARDVVINGASTILSTEMGNNGMTISGNVSGAGGISLRADSAAGNGLTLSGTNNTFEGEIRIGNLNNGGAANNINVASLADSADADGNIVFFNGNTFRSQLDSARFRYTGTTALTLNNRQIEFISTNATPVFGNIIDTTGAGSLTINTDLLVNTNVSQILALGGGTIANTNTFAGRIVDGAAPLTGSVLVSTTTNNTTYASGVSQFTLGTLQGISVGDSISGAGIADGTTITAINTATRQVTLSNPTTAIIATNTALTVAGAYNGTALRTQAGAWTISGANTFTGSTTIAAGVLTLGNSLALQNSALDTTGSVAGGANAGLRTNQTALTIGGLTGNKNFAATGGVFSTTSNGYSAVTALTLNVGAGMTSGGAAITTSYSGVIANGAAGMTLTKTGAGTQILSGTNTYTGATNINQGILSIGTTATPTGSINSSAVTINGGNFRYNSSTNYTNTLTFTSGTISGTNWNGSLGAQTIGTGQTISPGNSPGTATTTSQTWAAGGTYVWEINNVTGTAGADPGWDLINGTGTLDITASTGTEFIIDITSLTLGNIAGDAVNFDQMLNYAWMIADFASITGFNTTDFIVDATGFNGNTFTGAFAVALGDSPGIIGGDSTQIWVTYTAIPEPKVALLGCIGLLLLLRRRR